MITLYTKTHCGFCVQAKAWLNSHGYEYQEINIEHDTGAREFIQAAGHRTVPQIYWQQGDHLELLVGGGYQGLCDLGEGDLDRLIAAQHIDLSSLSL